MQLVLDPPKRPLCGVSGNIEWKARLNVGGEGRGAGGGGEKILGVGEVTSFRTSWGGGISSWGFGRCWDGRSGG